MLTFTFRLHRGLYTEPEYQFPGKKFKTTSAQLETFAGLLMPNDLLTNTVVVFGTTYTTNQLVVTHISNSDMITVGEIQHAVIRNTQMLFLVTLHDAIRTKYGFFQACPTSKVECIDYKNLSDYKPLIKRDGNVCFRFLLHHHLPTPID